MHSISGSWLRGTGSSAGGRAFAGGPGRRAGGLEDEECVVIVVEMILFWVLGTL